MPTPRSLSTAPHRDFELELISGQWPSDIGGDVLFSSPQNSRRLPYSIFDWGAICRLSLEPGARGAAPGRFAWQSRSIETPGKRLYNRHPDQFTTSPVGYASPFGPANSSNTAPLPWGNRLYTTWDGGRPVELNPDTLEFVAEVGHVDSWGGSSMPMGGVVPFLLSTAHPVADPDRGCLWTVKLEPVLAEPFGMRPSLVRYDRHDGTQVKHWPLDGIQFGGSIHTVSQTRDWIILCDSGNFKADVNEMFGGERLVTVDSEVPIWLIRKDQVEGLASGTPIAPICLTMAPPSGHYYARWDDSDGISVVWEGMDLMDLGLYLRGDDVDVNGNPIDPAVVGLYNMAMAPETLTEVILHPETAKVEHVGTFKEDWAFNLQLSAMDWCTEGMSAPTLHHVVYQGCRPGNISGRAAKMYEGRIDLDLLDRCVPSTGRAWSSKPAGSIRTWPITSHRPRSCREGRRKAGTRAMSPAGTTVMWCSRFVTTMGSGSSCSMRRTSARARSPRSWAPTKRPFHWFCTRRGCPPSRGWPMRNACASPMSSAMGLWRPFQRSSTHRFARSRPNAMTCGE